jgi:hypothetical protein
MSDLTTEEVAARFAMPTRYDRFPASGDLPEGRQLPDGTLRG